jgi:DNA replication and repair protein RecF
VLRLIRLNLTNFRSYSSLQWCPGHQLTVVTGPNGSGKTNLLEAVSLLVPGRGLRGARAADLPQGGAGGTWAVAAEIERDGFTTALGTGTPPEGPADRPSDRRVFRLNGAPPRAQAEIAALVSAVWLTPQMDRLFQEGASGRRRFLDRLTWALEPGHAREVSAYEQAMAGRNRLLAEGGADPAWLAGLEDSMARHAVAVAAARTQLVARLDAAAGAARGFPAARVLLLCPVADQLAAMPAIAAEDWLRERLALDRARDAAAGGAAVGTHRADMGLEDRDTGLPAAQASTGQQKALLIGVILAHAQAIAEARGAPPLLLLDEPAVHLDEGRRRLLFDALASGPAQAFLTGTDSETFRPLAGVAAGYVAGEGALRPDLLFAPPRSEPLTA